jgi:hypothetical protein
MKEREKQQKDFSDFVDETSTKQNEIDKSFNLLQKIVL